MSTANKMHSMELSSILERSTSDAMHDQSRQIEELRAKVRQLESTIVNLEQMDLLKLNKFIAEFTRKAQN
jgi:cell division protein FtsB